MNIWQTARRQLSLDYPLTMAILNVTPDSFSDGGKYSSIDAALIRVEKMIADGADIIDVGGESTRPGGKSVTGEVEILRTIPIIEAIVKRFDSPVSIDTTKSDVAKCAIEAGAEIINDISGLRFDEKVAEIAASSKAGLVLMHSLGAFESMHAEPPVEDILADASSDFRRALAVADRYGIADEQIVLDIGIGFGKTFTQNLELLGKLDRIVKEFPNYPIVVGASRKSFIGKLLGDADVDDRLNGSVASVAIAILNGAKIVRVHDARESVDAIKVAHAIRIVTNS